MGVRGREWWKGGWNGVQDVFCMTWWRKVEVQAAGCQTEIKVRFGIFFPVLWAQPQFCCPFIKGKWGLVLVIPAWIYATGREKWILKWLVMQEQNGCKLATSGLDLFSVIRKWKSFPLGRDCRDRIWFHDDFPQGSWDLSQHR